MEEEPEPAGKRRETERELGGFIQNFAPLVCIIRPKASLFHPHPPISRIKELVFVPKYFGAKHVRVRVIYSITSNSCISFIKNIYVIKLKNFF